MKKQLLVILSVILILMACLGVGIAAAEDSATEDSASDTGSDSSAGDSASDSGSSTEDSASDTDDGSSTDDSSATDDTSSDDSPSTDDSTSDDSNNVDDTTDEENAAESGAIIEDESDNTDDTTDEESTNESGDPVDDGALNTDIDDTMIVDDFDDSITKDNITLQHGGEFIPINNISSDDDYNYSSDDDTNINQTTNIENSTFDNSYNSWTNYTEKKDIYIDNSQHTNISFTDNSVVNNINFVSKESGKTKVIVKEVHDKPPVKNVYKSFNIQLDNKDVANNVKDAVVDFKVEKSWLKANGLDKSSIVLNMYDNGKWIEVPITITSEDSKYIYFKAKVSKYSTFAITGKTVVVDKVTKQSDSQNNGNSDEEIDAPTKNVVIKLLELIIDLLKE